jgi:4-diphosphocytidyl-2-C-methyl-D-erythritol kinase
MKHISPAKINLFLHVASRRPDGYHDLVTLMCPLALHDIIDLDFNAPSIAVQCEHPAVPEDHTNLAYRAADLFFTEFRQHPQSPHAGVRIKIEKNIPVAAGMGGGSSNAAAVLKGLNRHFNKPFSNGELAAIALKIGADVPFFILCKPAVATGVGEQLERVNNLTSQPIVLVNSGFGVSTAAVYKNLNLGLTKCGQQHKYFSFDDKNMNLTRILCNDLESVAMGMHPEINDLKEAMMNAGANAALMTGSGPTVFGVFDEKHKARAAYDRLSANKTWQVLLTQLQV